MLTQEEGRLGIPAAESIPKLQSDAFVELINKFAWVVGSVYRVPYSGKRCPARQVAVQLAKDLMKDHGYPSKIAQE